MKINYFLIILFVCIIIFVLTERFFYNKNKQMIEYINPSWYSSPTSFPYNDFKCTKDKETSYRYTVSTGYKIAKNKKIIFGGLCMNIENNISRLKERIIQLGSIFESYKCVIFENDSTDSTRKLLNYLCIAYQDFILVPCKEDENCILGNKPAKEHGMLSIGRMEKMASYRNRLLSFILENFKDYDYICFLDFDMYGPISLDGFAHSIGCENKWDGISSFGLSSATFSFGKMFYYDLLAYNDGDEYNNIFLDYPRILYKTSKYKVGDDLIKASGFAGLAIYKMDIFFNSKTPINYTPDNGIYICEHIIFHKNMEKNGYNKLYINPNMIILVGAQGDPSIYPIF